MTTATTPTWLSIAVEQAKVLLGQVPGVANVQDGEPHVPDWPTYLEAFKSEDGVIRGWLLFPELVETPSATHENHLALTLLIRGFESARLDAGSREGFRATVAAVRDALRYTTLNGAVEYTDPVRSRLPDGRLAEERMLGDVLCHVAELELIGHDWLTY